MSQEKMLWQKIKSLQDATLGLRAEISSLKENTRKPDEAKAMKLSDVRVGDKLTFAKPMLDGSISNWVVEDCELQWSSEIEISSLANWNEDFTDKSGEGFDIIKVERYQTIFEVCKQSEVSKQS